MVVTDYSEISSSPLLFIYGLGGGRNRRGYNRAGLWTSFSSWKLGDCCFVFLATLAGCVKFASAWRCCAQFICEAAPGFSSVGFPVAASTLRPSFLSIPPTLHLWSRCSLSMCISQAGGDCRGHSTTTTWGFKVCFLCDQLPCCVVELMWSGGYLDVKAVIEPPHDCCWDLSWLLLDCKWIWIQWKFVLLCRQKKGQ